MKRGNCCPAKAIYTWRREPDSVAIYMLVDLGNFRMKAATSKTFHKKFPGDCLCLVIAFALTGCSGMNNSSGAPGSASAVSVTLNQSSVNVVVGATTQFTARVANSTNTAVTWSVDGVAGGNATTGTISAAGLYTAPAQTGSHTVTAASVADPSAKASATVAVGLISVTPATTMVAPGGTQQFSATIQGFSNSSVTWSVNQVSGGNSAVGTITASGMYTAPSAAGSFTITATSVADTSAKANATLTVEGLSISPASAVVAPAGTVHFTAALPGVSNPSLTWSVDQVAGGNSTVGTITVGGLYTAPSLPGSHTITAATTTSGSVVGSATVAIDTISVSPATGPLEGSTTEQFSATVQGPSNPITWSVDQIAGGNSTVGIISTTGLYTAPASAGNHTISAAITADTAISASTAVSVFAFTVSPAAVTVAPSGTQQFAAAIQGLPSTSVTWSVDGVAGGSPTSGTITTSGLYSAPSTIGAHTITAISTADASASARASITVVNLAQAAVLTYHNDDARDGAYTQEVTLTPANVNSNQFGKLLSYPVDGQIYAQPLYVPHLTISGAPINVVFVATENNSVYAFNANASQTLWTKNLGTAKPNTDQYGVTPSLGITSTPVIDITTNTMYVLTETTTSTPFQLHALDITTGAEKFSGPVTVTGTVPGTGGDSSGGNITLEDSCYQRMGLALDPVTNAIYIAFGHCTHGWLLAYDKTTLQQTAIFNATPDGDGGGLWSSGGAPAIDDTTGDLYLISGVDQLDVNGVTEGDPVTNGYNDTFLRMDPTNLSVLDFFTPDDNSFLAQNDADLGSGSNILLPNNSSSTPHETIGGGKDGNIFVVNRDDMGGYNPPSTNNVIQTVQTGVQQFDNIFSTPVYWNGSLYYHCDNDVLQAYSWNSATGLLSTQPTSSGANLFGMHGATASLSANGTTNGIVWEIDNSNYDFTTPLSSPPSILHAYNATNVATELYNSTQAPSNRDQAGAALKFTVPTIADGQVFVGTSSELDIYGLLP